VVTTVQEAGKIIVETMYGLETKPLEVQTFLTEPARVSVMMSDTVKTGDIKHDPNGTSLTQSFSVTVELPVYAEEFQQAAKMARMLAKHELNQVVAPLKSKLLGKSTTID